MGRALPTPEPSTAVAARLGGRHHGPEVLLEGVAATDAAGPRDLAWYERGAPGAAGCLLTATPLEGRTCVVVPRPRLALAELLAAWFPERHFTGVHPSADVQGALGEGVAVGAFVSVGPGAVVGDGAVLYPGVVVGAGCRVGAHTVLYPRVVLYPGVTVGARCRVHAGAVLGADGFGFEPGPVGPVKVPQVGGLVVEDGVEIGANTCVDRAFLEQTRVGAGAALDNLVQVGHNATVGAGSLVAAQVGLGGSSALGRGVLVGGQAGVVPHVTVGDGARIGAGSGVARDVPAGAEVLGSPAMPAALTRRLWVRWRREATRQPDSDVVVRGDDPA